MSKNFYAAFNKYGINLSYDADSWMVFVFNSEKECDDWVDKNDYDGNQYVAEVISASDMRRILKPRKYQTVWLEDWGDGRKRVQYIYR